MLAKNMNTSEVDGTIGTLQSVRSPQFSAKPKKVNNGGEPFSDHILPFLVVATNDNMSYFEATLL